MSLDQKVRTFKWISILEAISFLVLLLIAMPLKYIWDSPEMVRVVGMLHGILFILYIMGSLWLYKPLNWSKSVLAVVWVSSVLPLGPLYVEKKYL